MKPHFKPLASHLKTVFRASRTAFFSLLITLFSSASVPLSWQVTPRNPAPVAFDRHHGETLEFRCQFEGFGELPFGQAADIRLWYQTNGMGAAWWSLPATVSSNVLAATFPPQADPGADRLALFFGAPSNAYASAVLRLRHSPGFTPNVLPAPESGYTETDPVFAAWLAATDLVHEEQDPTVPAWAKSETPPQTMTTNDVCNIVTNETEAAWSVIPPLPDGYMIGWYVGDGDAIEPSWVIAATNANLNNAGEYWVEGMIVSMAGRLLDPNATELVFGSIDNMFDTTFTATYHASRNALGLARLVDLPPLTNGIPDAAARAVYDVHDLMWDETESILYWHKIRQGHDEYIAVTNIDLTHPTNAVILKAWREANR